MISKRIQNAAFIAGLMAFAANAAIDISVVGDGAGYDETGVTAYRSTSVAKGFDADGNNEYGSEGLFFFGTGTTAANNQAFSVHTQSGAGWATFAQGAQFGSVSEQTNYGPYDDPTLSGSDVADWTICGIGVATGGGVGNWAEVLTFSIDAATPEMFRIGIMSGTQGDSTGKWDPTGLRLSVDGGLAAEITGLENTSGSTPGWVFFDVDLNGETSGTFSLEGQNRLADQGTAISGVIFDLFAGSEVDDPPVADEQSVRTLPDTPVDITLTGTDPEGSNLTYNVQMQPSHGTLSGATNVWTYSPANGYQGRDSFTFTVNDGQTNSAPATVSIWVTSNRPNFIIIFTDDQGYADLGCFGGTHVSTPRIDQMAAEGAKLTSFYVAGNICTPSRAALMTGCYPERIGMADGVFLTADTRGLNPDEVTIAEVLKSAGYATGMVGKWHLGDQPEFLPTRQGFEEYFGIPYSHDIHPYHPNRGDEFSPLPLLDGGEVIELEPDADYLTQRVTEHAIDFIERHREEPFFLYVPHPAPHRPISISPPFLDGVSPSILDALAAEEENDTIYYEIRDDLYYRAINEVDWSVGQILDTLVEQGIDANTLVIFTSDNGPSKAALGLATPLRGNKGDTWEGGMRMPTVVRWPGAIPADTEIDEVMSTMDLLPTFAGLAGADVPHDRVIDGRDIWPVLTEGAESPHEAFFYYDVNTLQAVRSGKWKLRLGKLYDLEADIGESTDVASAYPDIVTQLEGYMSGCVADIAANSRPAGSVETAYPLTRVSSTVDVVGDGMGYNETGAAAQGFRSTNIFKSFDLGDHVYGTSGTLFFGDGSTTGEAQAFSVNLDGLPAWVTNYSEGATLGSAPVAVFATYPKIDDPTLAPGNDVADMPNTGHVAAENSGAGTWSEVLKFSVGQSTPGFRLGIMSGHEANGDGRWDPTGIRVSVAGGAAVAAEATNLENLTNTAGMVFFDVATDGTTADTFAIEAQQRLADQGVAIAGITFDVLPPDDLEIVFDPAFSNNTFNVEWESRVGLTYILEGCASLTNGEWVAVSNEEIVATPPTNRFSGQANTNGHYFYRLNIKY
ncbi:Arylsulfatase [Pontiella desulfatans]|uniref:Arylsulfatase n=1 Tax=Pontiella desulfatans TaxID=2750659 RepID=A0A6C2U0G8_PONDE|nr:sulfatase-like hydrolase/transferase [Pontiella desulfatans]SPS73768.1 sulfatase S1_14 [Kiritimatiellales bacterium]VGO13214.1 Arylsulfatase [Pontiella desulfatans]